MQRHRARPLHYDVRFEVDGVLASWAVPRGPTLDPGVRRLAVHVEDHPIEYVDFEGVIPHGEYGGGDVIVWDRGRWEPYGTDDPAQAIADGELHADVWGEKLCGRFVLVRTGTDRSGKEQWLMFHKRDEHAQEGWDPEAFPRSVKSGRTNDEVAAEPDAEWRSDLPAEIAESRLRWDPPTADELAALDALGAKGSWEFDGQTLRLTNLDKVLFPGRDGEPPFSKRDLIRYYASVAPVMLPYLHDRPVNTRRYPDGVDKPGFWQKAVPSHAPDWITRWRNEDADPGETEWYVVADRPATLAWLANYGAVELHPWTSRVRPAGPPDLRPHRHRSRPGDDVRRRARARPPLPLGARPPRRGRPAQGERTAGPADLGAGRARTVVRRDPGMGREALPRRRRDRARAGELGVAGARARGSSTLGLHAERDQQDPGRPVQRAGRGGSPGVDPARMGRARRPRSAARWLDDQLDAGAGRHGATRSRCC